MTYQEIKSEVLIAAKSSGACSDEYRRAAKCESMDDLAQVMRDNFIWLCNAKVLTRESIARWGLPAHRIHHNEDCGAGAFLLATDSATVRATGSATVTATGSATVTAYDSSTVTAYDSSTVTAYGSATVTAYGSATVTAYSEAYVNSRSIVRCEAYDNAIVRNADRTITIADKSSVLDNPLKP